MTEKAKTEPNDESLMKLYQSGDAHAFNTLYARHSGQVLGYLVTRIGDRARAEEILQAVFLKLHRARHQYHPSQPFGPWFFSLIRTQLIDALRREFKNPARPGHEAPEAVLETLSEPQAENPPGTGQDPVLAQPLLDRLEPPHREVLELRYLREFSFEAIAARLGISSASARQRVSRAVKKLRSLSGGNVR
ncbi:MAG: RNA polymerase sigma factor [Oligoflexia bacterium]